MSDAIRTDAAPVPVGPYPHARRVGDLLFILSLIHISEPTRPY